MGHKTFYLFRHGETYFSKNELPYGEHERTAEILPEAIPSIIKIAEYLSDLDIEMAVRSEFHRCKQTAEIIEKNTNIRFLPEPLLNEFTETDFDAFHKRMTTLVKNLKSQSEEILAICTHGAVTAALRKLLQGKSFLAHDLMYYPKTGQVLVISQEREKEIDFR